MTLVCESIKRNLLLKKTRQLNFSKQQQKRAM